MPVEEGDEVVLFGPGDHGEPTAQEWADLLGTVSYDIVTRFTGKIPRSYSGVTNDDSEGHERNGERSPWRRDASDPRRGGACWRAGGLMVSWRKLTGVTGLAAGAIAAGVARSWWPRRSRLAGSGCVRTRRPGEPFGEVRGETMTVRADDGLPLHVEVSGPGRRAGHDHLLPRIHAELRRLVLPARGPVGCRQVRVLGSAQPRQVRAVRSRPGHHRPARSRSARGDAGNGARRHARRAGRSLDGRHDRDGAR